VMPETIWIRFLGRARLPHTHVIWHDATIAQREDRNEFAVEVAPGRVSMHQQDGFTAALVHKVHCKAIDIIVVWGKGEGSIKRLVFNVDQVYLLCLLRFPATTRSPCSCEDDN